MKYQCLQLTSSDCGFACLKVLLANVNNDENYLYLKQDLKKNNYTFLELSNLAKEYNLVLEGYKCDDLSLLKLPCICIISKNNINHYIIINKIYKNKLLIFDPLFGETIVNKNDFLSVFSKNVLTISSFKKTKCNNYLKIKSKINYKQFIFYFLQIFILFLITFLTNYSKVNSVFLIFIFIVLMYISSFFKLKEMKEYDQKEIYPALKYNLKNFEKEYLLKKETFEYKNKIVLSSIFIGFCLFNLLLSDLKNIFSLIVIFIMALVINYLKQRNSHLYKINNLENDLSLDNIKKADELSYKEYLYQSLLFCFELTIIAFITTLMCLINKDYTNYIYYLVLYFILFNEILSLKDLEKTKLSLNKKVLLHNFHKNN